MKVKVKVKVKVEVEVEVEVEAEVEVKAEVEVEAEQQQQQQQQANGGLGSWWILPWPSESTGELKYNAFQKIKFSVSLFDVRFSYNRKS